MTKKKGKARARPKPVIKTPEKAKMEKNTQLEFHISVIEREANKYIDELTKISETMLAAIETHAEECLSQIPSHLLELTLQEVFDAGYQLDYSGSHTEGEVFVSLAPFDFQPDPEPKRPKAAPANRRATRTGMSRSTRSTRPTNSINECLFTTPAQNTIEHHDNHFNAMLITPKVIPAPLRGHKVFYSEHGSPILVNQATMKAKFPKS